MNSAVYMEVIVTAIKRRGDGKSHADPVRLIREVFTLNGEKIAEYDPHRGFQDQPLVRLGSAEVTR